MTRFGSPAVGGAMPTTGRPGRVPSLHDERCTGCSRLSYTSGNGARINPLVDGLCPDCREGWACHGCGERHAFDDLSEEMECGRCQYAKLQRRIVEDHV